MSMSEIPGYNPENDVENVESIDRNLVLETCRSYELPTEYMEELEMLDDILELIGTASIWIQEEGHDLDEFLEKIGAL